MDAIPSAPPAYVALAEEFKKNDSGFIEKRSSEYSISVQGWQGDIDLLASHINSLKVTSLNLGAIPMRERDFSLFKTTDDWTSFSLTGTPVTGVGLSFLPLCPNVQRLSIEDCPIFGDRLVGLRRFPNAVNVKLDGCSEADEALRYLAEFRHLECLTVRSIRDFSGEGLIHFKSHPSIGRLDFCGTRISRGFEHLADCPRLQELSLEDTEVSSDQLKAIAKIRSLTRVYVGSSGISDESVAAFADHPNLASFGIFGYGTMKHIGITEHCLKHLEATPRIETISCYFRITETGLASLKKMRSLKRLYVNWPVITAEEVERIEQALPGCYVSAFYLVK